MCFVFEKLNLTESAQISEKLKYLNLSMTLTFLRIVKDQNL